MLSTSRGLILMAREIFFSSSNCSLVLVISFLASRTFAPADALAPPPLPAACCFSFCLHHFLSLHFCFFEAFLFLFSLLGLLFGLFLAKSFLLFLLLLI